MANEHGKIADGTPWMSNEVTEGGHISSDRESFEAYIDKIKSIPELFTVYKNILSDEFNPKSKDTFGNLVFERLKKWLSREVRSTEDVEQIKNLRTTLFGENPGDSALSEDEIILLFIINNQIDWLTGKRFNPPYFPELEQELIPTDDPKIPTIDPKSHDLKQRIIDRLKNDT